MDPKVRGIFLAHVMYEELEKIAKVQALKSGFAAASDALEAANPSVLRALKEEDVSNLPGILRQKFAVRGQKKALKKEHNEGLRQLRAAATRGLQSDDAELRARSLEVLQDFNRSSAKPQSPYLSVLQGGKSEGAPRRSAALLGTGLGLGAAGTLYASHRMNQSDVPEY